MERQAGLPAAKMPEAFLSVIIQAAIEYVLESFNPKTFLNLAMIEEFVS
ncbi:hypothetical protein [Thermoanaerobacterium sp. DL9XJH110]